MLRWRIDGLRMPTSGLAPLNDASALVTLIITAATLGFDQLLGVYDWIMMVRASVVWTVVVLLAFIPLWAWIFARPKLVEGATMRGWLRATGMSFLLLGVCGIAGVYTMHVDQVAFAILTPVSVMVATATFLDILDDLRARRRKLVPAGIVHQAQYIGALERVLDEADIPAHFHASHVRTLFAFFGAWAPIIVLVPEEHAAVAREKVYATITAAHREVVRAFARDARPTPARPLVPALARTS
jgi:hypothetical protein